MLRPSFGIPELERPWPTSASMSRWAVPASIWRSSAHLEDVSLPSKPSSRRLITRRCRSLKLRIDALPEARFRHHCAERALGAPDGAAQAAQKPIDPAG